MAVPTHDKPQLREGWRLRRAFQNLRRSRPKTMTLIMTTISFLLFLLLWQALSTWYFNPRSVPPPTRGFATGWKMIQSGRLQTDIIASLRRVAVGLSLGSAAGILLGLLIGRVWIFGQLVDPIVQSLRHLTPTAMIPIAIVWFGIGESSKYFLIFWGAIFFVTVNTTVGVQSVPITRIRAAQSLGASQLALFVQVILPTAVPFVLAGVRLGVASAFMSIIPAEILAAENGLGAALQQASALAQVDRIFVILAVIAFLGFSFDRVVQILGATVLRRFTRHQART